MDDPANSSIDQPSFQTEHEATFLWNNAKIIQNSLNGNSPAIAGRSPSPGNRKSHERNSFTFDSFMGNQNKSHNLSLDSPRKKKSTANDAGNELIQSQRVNNIAGVAGNSFNHTYNAGGFDKVMDRVSLSPPLKQKNTDKSGNSTA